MNIIPYENEKPLTRSEYDKIRETALEGISRTRREHILSVEREAVMMSETLFPKLGIPEEYIYDIKAAAILHDIMKESDYDSQIRVCEDGGAVLSEADRASLTVLHSFAGAYAAREKYGIGSRVFDAIYRHTVGDANMSVFDKIVFLADYTEPTRSYEGCRLLHEYFVSQLDSVKTGEDALCLLDECVARCAVSTLEMLAKNRYAVHPKTVETVESVLALHKGDPRFSELAERFANVRK